MSDVEGKTGHYVYKGEKEEWVADPDPEELEGMSKTELVKLAKERGIEADHLTKEELVVALGG